MLPLSSILLSLPFKNGEDNLAYFEQFLTCTRAGTSTRTNKKKLIEVVSANTLRLDYNPATGRSLGLLVEPEATNLLLRSEDIANSFWDKDNLNVTSNSSISPDGEQTADKIIANTTDSFHLFRKTVNAFSSGTIWISFFARKSGLNFSFFSGVRTANSSASGAIVDLTDGSVGQIIQNVGNPEIIVNKLVNDWYRINFKPVNSTGTINQIRIGLAFAKDGNALNLLRPTFVGNNTDGNDIWGVQMSDKLSSYIPTTNTSVTRPKDIITFNTLSWYEPDRTVVIKLEGLNGAEQEFLYLTDEAEENYIRLYRDSSNNVRLVIRTADTEVCNLAIENNSTNLNIAFTLKNNDVRMSVNASAPVSDSDCALPPHSEIEEGFIGSNGVTTMLGHITNFQVYSAAETNSTLQTLTRNSILQ